MSQALCAIGPALTLALAQHVHQGGRRRRAGGGHDRSTSLRKHVFIYDRPSVPCSERRIFACGQLRAGGGHGSRAQQAAGISGSLDELGSILQQMELEARGQVTASAAACISLLLLLTAWLLHGKG